MTLAEQIFEIIGATIILSIILAMFVMIIITSIFQGIRQREYIERLNEHDKKIFTDYLAIEKNPFKKVKNNGKNVEKQD